MISLFIEGPDIVKRNAFISGGVGAKSNKSEDDVFSDAPMEFSDSGISPQLEAPIENVGEMGKSLEHKGLEGGVYGSGVLGIKEAAGKHMQDYALYFRFPDF